MPQVLGEESLADVVEEFRRLVAVVVEPQWSQGRLMSSLYEQIRTNESPRPLSKGAHGNPMPPTWVAGLDWVVHVDALVRNWTVRTPWGARFPGDAGTGERLRWLADQKPRPQDVVFLAGWVEQLRKAHADAVKLLDPVQRSIEAECPECGARSVVLPDGSGDRVQHDALQMRQESVSCLGCNTVWLRESLVDLAIQIGTLPADSRVA